MAQFGYSEVTPEEKTRRVGGVFNSVASRYDLMNDLMSGGVHRLWKQVLVMHAQLRPGQRVLDLAGGTGDLTKLMRPILGGDGQIVLCDINDNMLMQGRDRMLDSGITDVPFVQSDASELPFPNASFDRVLISFGLRNVTDPSRCLREMHRVLRPSGWALVLEFSKPDSWLAPWYHAYRHLALPALGQAIVGDADSYHYLAESIDRHPDQRSLREMMRAAGFYACQYTNLSAGIVAIHRGARVAPTTQN